MTLTNLTKQNQIATKLEKADTLFTRLRGLLGRKEMMSGEALWILRTNTIHTWFMRFPIDAVFVDANMVVCKCFENLKPWRFTLPIIQARSVIELPAGVVAKNKIEKGDQLSVLH